MFPVWNKLPPPYPLSKESNIPISFIIVCREDLTPKESPKDISFSVSYLNILAYLESTNYKAASLVATL